MRNRFALGATRIVLLIAISIGSLASSPADTALQPRKLLDGRLTMLVPANFTPMSEERRKAKYTRQHAPPLVLSNASGSVNIAIHWNKGVALEPRELKTMLEPMRKQLADGLRSIGIRSIGDREYLVYELDVQTEEGFIRNLAATTSLSGKMLSVSFNCLLDENPA